MALGKVLAAATGSSSLKQLIRKELRRETPVSFLTPEKFVRVSSFASMCAREEVICANEKIERADSVEPDLMLIFAHGTSLHWGLQNIILPTLKVLYGTWRCHNCGKLHGAEEPGKPWTESIVLRPETCKGGCENSVAGFTYEERMFRNEEFGIQGHPDGFLVIPGMPGIGILEAKSIGMAFKIKNAPQIDHVIQAQCYMWLSGLKWAKILYWEKGGQGVNALTEHLVERDNDTIKEIKNNLLELRFGLTTGDLPVRICESSTCPRAKGCPVVEQCFSDSKGIQDETHKNGDSEF